MKVNSFCLTCLIQMQESQIRKFDDEEKKMRYMPGVFSMQSESRGILQTAPSWARTILTSMYCCMSGERWMC